MTSIGTYHSKKENMQRRIDQIDSLFTGETDHLLYLYGFIPGGLKCHKCQSIYLDLLEGDRTALCSICGKVTYLTARTFLHGVRRPIDWVRAMWLLEEGYAFSANMFSAVTGMTTSSVSSMLSKLFIVLSNQMTNCAAESSSSFLPVLSKRSLQTPAMKHPQTEQDVFDEIENENRAESLDLFLEKSLAGIYENREGADEDTVSDESTSAEHNENPTAWSNEKNVFKLLSKEPTSFEHIGKAAGLTVSELAATLVHLEIAGLIKPMPGQRYIQKRLMWTESKLVSESSKKENVFKPFFEFVARTFHGISRKYLQLYLSAYWCCTNRNRWNVGSLFTACMRNKPLTYRDRLAYVSPPVVAYYLQNEKN